MSALELGEVMQREADRVARLFGFEKAGATDMPGKPVGVEITYKCDACRETFTVWTPLEPTNVEFSTFLYEEHEDCPKGDE